jgi:hypothetical protein
LRIESRTEQNEFKLEYVGFCPDLFPWGGACHASAEEEAYHQLCDLVHEEVNELRNAGKELPFPGTRPMREVVMA